MFIIKEDNPYKIKKFVQRHHYSPVFPKLTKYFLGVYDEEELVGAITLG
jgi:hypothetical protein